jgi:hypothetical protein
MENNGVSTYHMARFITIAMDIAERIASEEYVKGQKISGASTLAAFITYLRKYQEGAVAFTGVGVVKVLPGTGRNRKIGLKSAKEYLAESSHYKVIKEMRSACPNGPGEEQD